MAKKEQDETMMFLKKVNTDDAEEVLQFVLERRFSEIRANSTGNTASQSYYRMTKLIKAAIELLYHKEQSFDIVLIDGERISITAGSFSCNLQGINLDDVGNIYFNQIIELSSISDGDNIYQPHDTLEDGFNTVQAGFHTKSQFRVRQLS